MLHATPSGPRPLDVMHMLLRTDDARDHLSLDVGGAGQTAALLGHVVKQKTVTISQPAESSSGLPSRHTYSLA